MIELFKEINNKRYIPGINNNPFNSAGLTFEHLIGKSPDSSRNPDFDGIEIKTKTRYSRHDISLFCIGFNGPFENEGNRIRKKYGYENPTINQKELITRLIPNKLIKYNDYYIEYKIDHANKRTSILFFDNNYNFIEECGYIDFDKYKNAFETKLKKLALIRASKKQINNNYYFRYYSIKCFISKSFNNFMFLLENGIINISLQQRFSKTNISENKNKNIVLSISEKDIYKLFDIVYEYEN